MTAREDPILRVAIFALGGQGGGVLANWLVELAQNNGWYVQSTSVPGVAQRTGATIYYLEMLPDDGSTPVLALMPEPAGVDLLVAAELAEAGRAIQRGVVSAERTVLLASDHRAFAVSEKSQPGDGTADYDRLLKASELAAKKFLHADMAELARRSGSVISASLFGGIAASGVLPFPLAAFRATIAAQGRGGDASSRAFEDGLAAIAGHVHPAPAAETPVESGDQQPRPRGGSAQERAAWEAACRRIDETFPEPCRAMLRRAVDSLVDYQDAAYAHDYLHRMVPVADLDHQHGGPQQGFTLTIEVAKYLARAMAYDDVIRVADLKTRAQRGRRIRHETGAVEGQVVHLTEYFHPRVDELCATLPYRLGQLARTGFGDSALAHRLIDRGRRIRSDSLRGFLLLYSIAGLRRFRRRLLRHREEMQHIGRWLDALTATVASDYALAVELARCRRLIKGYSDTHSRGLSRYDRLMGAAQALQGDPQAARQLAELRECALHDPEDQLLDQMLKTYGLSD